MSGKLMVLAAVLAILLVAFAPLVLAQQDQSAGRDTGIPEEGTAGGDTPLEVIDLNGSSSTDAGFVQYGSEPPPGAYYDCPPLTEPRMLRPCILVRP